MITFPLCGFSEITTAEDDADSESENLDDNFETDSEMNIIHSLLILCS